MEEQLVFDQCTEEQMRGEDDMVIMIKKTLLVSHKLQEENCHKDEDL